MIAAGLVAKKAVEKGLSVKPYVKTSLAPGSRVVTEYLEKAGLLEPLATLGFNVVGYGCTTCIGNSGPLPGEVVKAITSENLVAASVLSGNRNFEGRIHPYVRANYLASPPLVVIYALAGTVDIDLQNEPLGNDAEGKPGIYERYYGLQTKKFLKQHHNMYLQICLWINIKVYSLAMKLGMRLNLQKVSYTPGMKIPHIFKNLHSF